MGIIAPHNTFYLAYMAIASIWSCQTGASPDCSSAGPPAKEATMDMTLRLNVLLTLLSFGFIAAIVLGMV